MKESKNSPNKQEIMAKINLSQPLHYLHYYLSHDFNTFNNMNKMRKIRKSDKKIIQNNFCGLPQNKLQQIERLLTIKNIYRRFSNSSENEFRIDSYFYNWLKIKNIHERIIFLLKKILKNKENKKDSTSKLFLLEWRKNIQNGKYNRAAVKIQKAFLTFYLKRKHMKINYSIVEKNKNIKKFVNKIFQVSKYVFAKLKQENSRRKLIKFFTFLKNKMISGPAYNSFRKLKKFYKNKLSKITNNVVKIQKNYKAHKVRNDFKTQIIDSNFPKTILKYINKLSNNKVFLNFLKWSKISNNIKNKENAIIIQKYLRKVRNFKNSLNTFKMKKILKNIFSDYRDINLSQSKNKLIKTLKLLSAEKKLLSYIFRTMNKKISIFISAKKLKLMCHMFKKYRSKRNIASLDMIKNFSFKKKQNKSAVTIQKYLFKKIKNVKTQTKKQYLNSIINKKYNKESFNKIYFFKKWNKITKNINLKTSGEIIKNFIRKKNKNFKNKNLWIKILNFSYKKNLKDNVKTIKLLFFQKKYQDIITNHLKRICIDKIQVKIKKHKNYSSFRNYLIKKYEFDKHLLLDSYFQKLKRINNFYKERENCTNNLMNIIKGFHKKMFPLKHLLFPIKFQSLKYFFKKHLQRLALKNIKRKSYNKTKLLTFASQFANLTHLLKDNSKLILRKNLYQIYRLKFLKDIQEIINSKIRDTNKEPFFNKLLLKVTNQSQQSYKRQIKRLVIIRPNIFKFSVCLKNKNIANCKNTSSISKNQHESIYLHKILTRLFLINKKQFFEKIKNINRGKKLNSCVSHLVTKTSGPVLFSKLKLKAKASKDLESSYSQSRRRISSIIMKLLKNKMKDVSKMTRLFYLLKVIRLQKEISKNRFKRIILKKWQFDTGVKRISKQKMRKLYESYHLTFLNMANELYNQDYGQIYDLVSNNNSSSNSNRNPQDKKHD